MKRAVATTLLILAATCGARRRVADAGPEPKTRFLDPDVDTVYAAIDDAATKKDPASALPLLEGALATPFPHVAVLCGDAARALPPAALADAKVDALVKKTMRAPDVRRAQNLVRFVAATRSANFDAALAWGCAAARPAEVQIEAVSSCGGMGAVDAKSFPKTADALGDALASPRDEIRAAACAAIGRMRLAAHGDAVLRLALAGDELVSAFAAVACRRLKLFGRLAEAKRALGAATNSDRREAGLRLIMLLGGDADLDTLVEMLHSPKADEREVAARSVALARAREPDAAPIPAGPEWSPVGRALAAMVFDDPAWNVRDAARVAALRLGAHVKEDLAARVVAQFDSKDDDVALAALELAGELGVADAAPALLAVITGLAEPDRRDFAARALGRINEHNAVALLTASLSGPGTTERSRRSAARALGFVPSKDAVDALVRRLREADLPAVERDEVERALERLTGHRFGTVASWDAWLGSTTSVLLVRMRKFDRGALRKERGQGALATSHPDAERAIENALRWLEAQQHPLGDWDGAERGFAGYPNAEAWYTSLVALAFLGAGYGGTHGRYREVVRRATDAVVGLAGRRMGLSYSQGRVINGAEGTAEVANVVVIEAGTVAQDRDMWPSDQAAVDGLLRKQIPGSGMAADPQPTKVASLADSAWAMQGFSVARAGGLDVPDRVFDGIDRCMESASTDVSGLVEDLADAARPPDRDVGPEKGPRAYAWWRETPVQDRRDRSTRTDLTVTHLALVLRLLEGWPRSNPFLVSASRVVALQLPEWEAGALLPDGKKLGFRSVYWFYGLVGMHGMGGGRWRTWWETARRVLLEHRRVDLPELAGSWDPDVRNSPGEGRLDATALNVLALEAPYRYPLPATR